MQAGKLLLSVIGHSSNRRLIANGPVLTGFKEEMKIGWNASELVGEGVDLLQVKFRLVDFCFVLYPHAWGYDHDQIDRYVGPRPLRYC